MDAAPPDSYESLLARLRAGDTGVDYRALRLAYTRTAAYAPYRSEGGARFDRVNAAAGAGDFAGVQALADAALAENYTDIDAHAAAAFASARLGDEARAGFHRAILRGLADSVLRTAGGRPDSPFVVISVDEEYALLRVLGMQSQGQALEYTPEGHPCDRIDAVDPETGERRTLYFDVSIPTQYMADQLGQ